MEPTIFHLAFPVHDLELAKQFYHQQLGCELGRQSKQALIMSLGGHQIVAHKVTEQPQEQVGIYPRHFGLIFTDELAFNQFVQRLRQQNRVFEIDLKIRFEGSQIEHQSFFLKDPSNNLLEFKCYRHASAIFGETAWQQVGEN